jgi:hypothetical protein
MSIDSYHTCDLSYSGGHPASALHSDIRSAAKESSASRRTSFNNLAESNLIRTCHCSFSFDTDQCRRVKTCRRIIPGGKTSGRPSRQP